MAIQKKIKGFVLLNINTDEYSFLKPVSEEKNSSSNVNSAGRSAASSIKSEDKLPISLEQIYSNIKILEKDIQNIHIKGSRLYGVVNTIPKFGVVSDWDLTVIANTNTPYEFIEFTENNIPFDIHIFNRNEFLKRLDEYEMDTIEFLFHPESSIIIDKEMYSLNIQKEALINSALAESQKQWYIARSIINDPASDVYRGLKRVWHSIRYLIFAEQILKYGKIINFSAANSFYADIINSNFIDFSYFETNFLPIRIQLENTIKGYLTNSSGESIETNVGKNPDFGPINGPPSNIKFDSISIETNQPGNGSVGNENIEFNGGNTLGSGTISFSV